MWLFSPEGVPVGFSKGDYTGLVLVGADPDFHGVAQHCTNNSPFCEQDRNGNAPTNRLHDARIKAVMLADTASAVGFTADNFANIGIPVQIWRSEFGAYGSDPEGTARLALALPAHPDIHALPAALCAPRPAPRR